MEYDGSFPKFGIIYSYQLKSVFGLGVLVWLNCPTMSISGSVDVIWIVWILCIFGDYLESGAEYCFN